MSKFEINQKVFDYSYGWGKIIKIITTSDSSEEPIIIFANNKDVYNIYDLEGRNVYKDDYIRSRNENYNNMSKRLSRRKILGRK